jgi:hypothetical protein
VGLWGVFKIKTMHFGTHSVVPRLPTVNSWELIRNANSLSHPDLLNQNVGGWSPVDQWFNKGLQVILIITKEVTQLFLKGSASILKLQATCKSSHKKYINKAGDVIQR